MLSDGVFIKRGSSITIPPPMRDPSIHENPEEFDGYRFYRIRQQPGKKNVSISYSSPEPICSSGEINLTDMNELKTSQLVTTSPTELGFGYGQHACPGRFLAVNEVKIVLCHFILKYEWRLPEGAQKPHWVAYGNALDSDRVAKIEIRRRDSDEVEGLF